MFASLTVDNIAIIPQDDVHRLNMIGVDGAMRITNNISSAFNPTKDLIKSAYSQTGNNQSRKSSFDGFLFAICFSC